ncbi:hypothetical protein ACI2OX_20315 [Bacillus sp. N9]
MSQPHPSVPKPQMLLLPETMQSEAGVSVHERFLLKRERNGISFTSPVTNNCHRCCFRRGIGWHQSFIRSQGKVEEKTNSIFSAHASPKEDVMTKLITENEFSAFLVKSDDAIWIFIEAVLSDEKLIAIIANIAATITQAGTSIVIGATQTGNILQTKK